MSALDELLGLGATDWPDPIPLATHTGEPPAFPVDALPDWMQAHVEAVAYEQQVAVDLPAMLGISALSLVNAKRYRVHVQGDWHEPVNTYLVVALPPSAGKSPVFKRMFRAIEAWEADLLAEAIDREQFVEQRRRMIEKAMAKAENGGDHVDAEACLRDLNDNPAVIKPRLIADDITVEALVDLLSEQGGRLGLLSTEGGLFDAMAGRYSDKANLDPYLQAWAGDTIRTDRVARGHTIVRDPLLTIGLTVQPSVIEALAAKPEFAGRGLTARFMYSVPVDFVGHRNFLEARQGNEAAATIYEQHITRMLAPLIPDEPATIELAPKAWQMFAQWRQKLEHGRVADGELRPMATWTTKLESTVIRLAGLLQVSKGGPLTVSPDVMGRALTVGEYWIEHAKIVYDMWGTSDLMAAARVILKWLTELAEEEFSVRDLYRARRVVFPTAEATVAPLELLMERGWIRPMFTGALSVGHRGFESPRFQKIPRCGTVVNHVNHVPKDTNQCLSSSSSVLTGESGGSDITDMVDMVDNSDNSEPLEGLFP